MPAASFTGKWVRAAAALVLLLPLYSLAGCVGEDDAAATAPEAAAVAPEPGPTTAEMDSALAAQDVLEAEAGVTGRIEGIVVDEHGEGVAMASVLVEGTTIGAATDGGGRFVLTRVPTGEVMLDVRGGGKRASHRTIVKPDDPADVRISL